MRGQTMAAAALFRGIAASPKRGKIVAEALFRGTSDPHRWGLSAHCLFWHCLAPRQVFTAPYETIRTSNATNGIPQCSMPVCLWQWDTGA